MKPNRDEELRQLFEQFLTSDQAEAAVNDVLAGEQLLHEHPAPEPAPEVLADIKATVAVVAYRHSKVHKIAYRVAVAAAVVMILSAVATKLWENKTDRSRIIQTASILPTWIWESDDIAANDPDLASFSLEIEQIEQQLKTLQSGSHGGNSEMTIEDLQMELVEIDSDFWKG